MRSSATRPRATPSSACSWRSSPRGVRLAITGAGQGGVFRHTEMEKALSANFSPDAIAGITTPADGLNGDIHASAGIPGAPVGVISKRAVAKAT